MVKVLFALAKYLTWFNHLGRGCVANLAHMLQTSSFNQTYVLVASNSISPSLLNGGGIYIITLLNPLPVLIILLNLWSDTLGDTLVHTLVHDKYSPARWVSRKLRPKSKTIPCFPCLPRIAWSCLLFVHTMPYK